MTLGTRVGPCFQILLRLQSRIAVGRVSAARRFSTVPTPSKSTLPTPFKEPGPVGPACYFNLSPSDRLAEAVTAQDVSVMYSTYSGTLFRDPSRDATLNQVCYRA
jgi:hypothetical protein